MKINKSGFTMVELLAVIVIMGVLMALGLPILTNTIKRNRYKSYISDAYKMVSRAEYLINAKSNVIEKPDEGNAIVLNLKYLDDGSFSSAPYNGSYNKEASFVVAINNGDELVYYVMLVEDMPKNGGHFGINLEANDNLDDSNPSSIDNLYLINGSISPSTSSYIISTTGASEIENYYYEP